MAHENWSEAELRAAVEAYLEMLSLHHKGKKYVKKHYYRDLARRFQRTEKSFEYRAQNISHVFALLGREWIPGLVPARNVGPNVVEQIEIILAQSEGRTASGEASFESRVREALKRRKTKKPKGEKTPTAATSTTTTYQRDPEVKAWVLHEANGSCEYCGATAPFVTHDAIPFLEVHSLRRLADGGSDRVENTVAVCPNCHRALHYSRDRTQRMNSLYGRVARLVRE